MSRRTVTRIGRDVCCAPSGATSTTSPTSSTRSALSSASWSGTVLTTQDASCQSSWRVNAVTVMTRSALPIVCLTASAGVQSVSA